MQCTCCSQQLTNTETECRGSVVPAPAALSFPCPATATTNGLGRTHVRIRPPLTLCSCAFSQCYAPNWGIQKLQNQACIPDPAQVVCMPVSDPAQPFVPGLSLESGRSRSPKPLAIINALAWLMEGCLPRGATRPRRVMARAAVRGLDSLSFAFDFLGCDSRSHVVRRSTVARQHGRTS